MAAKHLAWIVNVDGSEHIVSFDFSSGSMDGYISISVDNIQVVQKRASSANDFNGIYPINIGSKFAKLKVEAKALAIVRGFDLELEIDGLKIRPLEKSQQGQHVNTTEIISRNSENANPIIHLATEYERTNAKTESIEVPKGVNVKIKRSRTVEHTMDINWRASGGANIEAGLKQLISASLHGELEKSTGQTFQQSETLEYEVELNGDRSNKYKLTWVDVWQKGTIELQKNGSTIILPFQFRERSELTVTPDSTI